MAPAFYDAGRLEPWVLRDLLAQVSRIIGTSAWNCGRQRPVGVPLSDTQRAPPRRHVADLNPEKEPQMTIDIPADVYADIATLIGSDASPVGIDAKKTHIMILHKLIEIERRLARLEGKDPR